MGEGVKASVGLRGGLRGHDQRLDITLGVRSQPEMLLAWAGVKVGPFGCAVSIEQPNPDMNFAVVRLRFTKTPTKAPKGMKSAAHYRRPDGSLRVNLPWAIREAMPYPIPMGRYEGTLDWGDNHASYAFQSVFWKRFAPVVCPHPVITMGAPEDGKSIAILKESFPRLDGMGG